ncbi:transposase [Tenacibaculum finnmarkense]|uniref:ISAon1 family transposase N-terminal region protein n=1 Tax=Tenacibaculum finnmarkense TaxID=2781243 RepID=UPI001EFB31D8|nr:transposase [Tenacibaculum finnmarkense]MCG8737835.1 transposase [Tenacibaculum finnmarkense]
MNIALAKYFLPEGILDYFDIVSDKIENDQVHFYLEEKNLLPKEYKSEIAQSKGFLPEITVEDFPLRGKCVLLHIKRRRWTLLSSQKIIKRDWNLIAKGTRITSEFADFLKGIS